MNQKILNTLEFPKIIQELASYASSNLGKELALELKPSPSLEDVQQWQDETADGVQIERLRGRMPIPRLENVRPHLKRLDIGASLNALEIAQIGKILTTTTEIRRFFDDLEETGIEFYRLYDITKQFITTPQLNQRIRSTVNEDGHVLDDASTALRGIRTGIKKGENAVREKLESVIRGKSAKYLSDALITIRNDRYVVPVKQEYRGHFGGVVHDQSSTGQTLFIEPKAVVELNNRLRQLQIEERHEVDRILAELSNEIAPYSKEINNNMLLLAQLDFIGAKAGYAKSIQAIRPEIHLENEVKLYHARHPLLDQESVVANDIFIGGEYQAVVITGPNTGGKTVILKTLGLLQLMGQSGLQIPAAEESQIGIFHEVFADIGDEQSIEQSLSTFSSHMTNIVSILRKMDDKSLIILDELGAGTDPQEGAALAIAILDQIGSIGSSVMVTSHYPELKVYGYNHAKTINASMEFDVDTLSPTYRLLFGVPGRSNAFEISKRLGLSPDIIQNARHLIDGETQNLNEMIADLENTRKMTEMEYQEVREHVDEADALLKDLKTAVQDFWQERDDLVKKAQIKANQTIEEAQEEAEKVIADLRNKQLESGFDGSVKEHEFIDAKTRLANLKHEEALAQNKILKKEKAKQTLKPGDDVKVQSFGQKGTIVEKAGDKQWVVQMGMLKMKLDESDLILTAPEKEPTHKMTSLKSASQSHVSPQLDLRGERYDSALARMDQYLDSALLANYPQVTIVHGKGTGALRKGVTEALKRHPSVKGFSYAPANQGGNGATIVEFKN
ncbi:endonuclease MutS2 [Desemzia sp. RIT804]|uniref:endonuclease MutS2 n=1 Tax=Desemzia sp. RIT 804 TaxID=2810209 RepID=UPI00194FA020|nr:endonuclease MutS2 [Desemzia sp. RIT 804]MBM6613318.1 endonuclease MutS2 [Desemzia sp. RIT 804]